MTAKDREIQVYEMNVDQIPSDWPRDFVAHADHLRAVKLAQIEALQSLYEVSGNDWRDVPKQVQMRIEALRKDLDGSTSAEPETTTNRIANRGWIND